MGSSESSSGPARSPSSGVRSQEAERESRESTGAAAASWTVLSGEEEEQKRLSESTGLRAGDTRAADNQETESRELPLPPPGSEPREPQAPPPPSQRENMWDATTDSNTGPTGRDSGCNMASLIRGASEEMVRAAGVGLPAAEMSPSWGETGPRDGGALPWGAAEESCVPDTTPGGTREEASDRLSLPAPPQPVVDRHIEGERGGADRGGSKWSPGRRGKVK